MIGALIGAAAGIGGQIFGGIQASQAMKKAKRNIEMQKDENQNWYDRRYNEDGTQRADAQRVLTLLNENVNNRNRRAAGAQAVMGGTDESVAAAKAANNEAVADAMSRIAANSDARKDNIEAQYRTEKRNLEGQLNGLEYNRAMGVTRAIGGVASAAGALGTSIDDYIDSRRKSY